MIFVFLARGSVILRLVAGFRRFSSHPVCLQRWTEIKTDIKVGVYICLSDEWVNQSVSIALREKGMEAFHSVQFNSVAQSCPTLWLHGLQHARLPCPSPTPGAYSNSCPLSWWCHPTISSSVIPFSSRLQSFSASGSFPMSQFFAAGGQSTGASASTSDLPMNTQDWSPLGWTG